MNWNIRRLLREYFHMSLTSDEERQTVESIVQGVRFRGAQLWVLIFAIFIASLGLNVNSTAVIIGAMLISPLMGPIIGMGLSIGITDFDLFKRSLKNYCVATGISVLTATVYFLFTPITEAQSELLARTSPNIYDVLIALFGGLAGIVAICAKDKGNVLPGVAIATALMPPLCTAGYGLATAQWMYFFGAFYLFFINTVFISLATFAGVRMMRFHQKTYDANHSKLIRRYISIIVVVTVTPAVYLTYQIVKETLYKTEAQSYISKELSFPNAQIIQKSVSYKQRTINVVLMGEEVDEKTIAKAQERMANYRLGDTKLQVVQGINGSSVDLTTIKASVMEDLYEQNERTINEQRKRIVELEREVEHSCELQDLSVALAPEMRVLFPEVTSISLSSAVRSYISDSIPSDTFCLATLSFRKKPSAAEVSKINDWLKTRTHSKSFESVIR